MSKCATEVIPESERYCADCVEVKTCTLYPDVCSARAAEICRGYSERVELCGSVLKSNGPTRTCSESKGHKGSHGIWNKERTVMTMWNDPTPELCGSVWEFKSQYGVAHRHVCNLPKGHGDNCRSEDNADWNGAICSPDTYLTPTAFETAFEREWNKYRKDNQQYISPCQAGQAMWRAHMETVNTELQRIKSTAKRLFGPYLTSPNLANANYHYTEALYDAMVANRVE